LNGDFLAGKGVGWAAVQTPGGIISVFNVRGQGVVATGGAGWGCAGRHEGCRSQAQHATAAAALVLHVHAVLDELLEAVVPSARVFLPTCFSKDYSSVPISAPE